MIRKIVTDGLVGYWHPARADYFSEGRNSNSTNVLKDLTGNLNDGTLQNFSYTDNSGWVGEGTFDNPYGLRLNGNGFKDWVDLGTGLQYMTHTIEAWIKADSDTQVNGCIFSKYGNYYGASRGFGISIGTGGVLRYNAQVGSGTPAVFDGNKVITDGKIYHVAITSNLVGSGNVVKIYINGALDKSGTPGMVTDWATNPRVKIGSSDYYPSLFFKGTIYAIRFYNRVLSDAEVFQNYSAGYLWFNILNTGIITQAGYNDILNNIKVNWKYIEFLDEYRAPITRVQVDNNNISYELIPGYNKLTLKIRFNSSLITNFPKTITGIKIYKEATGGDAVYQATFEDIILQSSTDEAYAYCDINITGG